MTILQITHTASTRSQPRQNGQRHRPCCPPGFIRPWSHLQCSQLGSEVGLWPGPSRPSTGIVVRLACAPLVWPSEISWFVSSFMFALTELTYGGARSWPPKRSPWGREWGDAGSEQAQLSDACRRSPAGGRGGGRHTQAPQWALGHLWRKELPQHGGRELTINFWIEFPLLNFRPISQRAAVALLLDCFLGQLWALSLHLRSCGLGPQGFVCGAKWQVLPWGNLPFSHLAWSLPAFEKRGDKRLRNDDLRE